MALINSKEMFKKALNSDYAIGAFNINNMETIQGIVDATCEENSPVILQVSAGARKYARPSYLLKLTEAAMIDRNIDICLHLDHGEDFDICKRCIDDGFTSVMIDGSKLPFMENVEVTRKVVEYAHKYNVTVEAELGKLAGVEDNVNVDAKNATFTDPKEAKEFVDLTEVDSLAIAIGTSHGAYKYKGDPYLDIDRLKGIHQIIPNTPLVLHGASTVIPEFVAICNKFGGNVPGARGVSEELITEASKYGICKVNIDTDLRLAMTAKVREYLALNPSEFDPRKYLGEGRIAIKEMVAHKMRDVLKSSNMR